MAARSFALILRPKWSSSAHSNAIVSGDKERLHWYLSSVLKGLSRYFARYLRY